MPDRAARKVLDAWLDRLRPLAETAARARWTLSLSATPENAKALEAARRAQDAALRDPEGFRRVEQSLSESVADPILRRALEVLRLDLLPFHRGRPEALVALETKVQQVYGTFRATRGDRRLSSNDVTEVLRRSTDAAELEATWRAAVALGAEVGDHVRELARLRNEQARALGFRTYRDLALHASEVDAAWLDRFLLDLAEGTGSSFAAWKESQDERLASRFGLDPGLLKPWHYGGVFFEGLPPGEEREDPFADADLVALTRKTFDGVGLDVGSALARSDLFPREGKNQHAFCTHLDRAGDVRVLCNLAQNERWMRTMVHEFGHAAFDLGLDFALPWNLVRPAHVGVTEAVAMLFGRLPRDPLWLERVARIHDDGTAERHGREALLLFVRWALVVVEFERCLYEDPDGDLDSAWWGLVERLQGIPAPKDRPDSPWAAKIHVALFPVYYHSYLMGECFASQMARHLREHVAGAGLVGNAEAGRWLSEHVFRPGALVRWDRLIERATGRPLEAAALLDDCLMPTQAV